MTERVAVFIDGQNLVKAVRKYHKTRVHPILLGRHLAAGRELAEIRYYSGIHQPRENANGHALATRRHKLIRKTGVTVIERKLQYHWEWKIQDRLEYASRADDDATHQVTVEKSRVAREKGIDMALGLDAVAGAFSDHFDTAIVVSRDRDLLEIAREIHDRARLRNVNVEVALLARETRHVMKGYDYTHWIDEAVIAKVRDDFDYRGKLPKAEVKEFMARVRAEDPG